MKTWTNPTVEELEVKMTANGVNDSYWETGSEIVEDFTGWNPGDSTDKDWINDNLKKDKNQS